MKFNVFFNSFQYSKINKIMKLLKFNVFFNSHVNEIIYFVQGIYVIYVSKVLK